MTTPPEKPSTPSSSRRRSPGGRPALTPDERRRAGPRLALTPAELVAIERAATRRGLPVSVWVRETALAAAGLASAVPVTSAPPPVVAALLRELARVGVNLNQLAHAANRAGLVVDNPASARSDKAEAEASLAGAVAAAAELVRAGAELAALAARIEAAFAPGPTIAPRSRTP